MFEDKLRQKLEYVSKKLEDYDMHVNVETYMEYFLNLEQPQDEILTFIDNCYIRLKESQEFAKNFSNSFDDFSLIQNTSDKDLSGIIGGFHLSRKTLHLHSQFKNTEEGKAALKAIRSQNLPANMNELTDKQKSEARAKAKTEKEVPAMLESISELLPYLEKMSHIKSVSVESNKFYLNYIMPALEYYGFKEEVRDEKDKEAIEKECEGATSESGNRYKCFSVSSEVLIENIKNYCLKNNKALPTFMSKEIENNAIEEENVEQVDD